MNRTKQNIIDEFRRLLIEKPYTSITVRDIVERCGINRNTFYYYFAGIPELVVSYIEARADYIIEAHGRIETPLDCIEPLVELITENKQSISIALFSGKSSRTAWTGSSCISSKNTSTPSPRE